MLAVEWGHRYPDLAKRLRHDLSHLPRGCGGCDRQEIIRKYTALANERDRNSAALNRAAARRRLPG